MTDDQTTTIPTTPPTDTPSDTPSSPITVKPGWWKMRDGEEIQVFEWHPDPPAPGNPFKFCGMTPAGDVIYWTDDGYCNFNASTTTQGTSDADLFEFIRPLDTDQIVSLSETLQQKHRVIQEMTHQIADLQTNLAAVKLQADTMADTIMTQAKMIDYQRTNIEATVTNRLADLQQRYNDMVIDRNEWQERATQMERIISSNTLTIASLQSQLSNLSKKQQSAETQAAIDGIAALRAENDRLSAKNESIARLALAKQEENDKLQIRLDAMTNAFESQAETSRQLRDRLEKCLSANAELIASVDAMARLREQVSHPNLSLIVAKLATPDNQQQQQIIISGLMILSQLVRKNMDYQGSAFTPPILLPKTSPIVAMCCRASDKIARLANLLSGTRKQVESETVLDTIGDLAGYATLLYSYCNTIQGTAELEAIIETASGTSHHSDSDTTTDASATTTTIDTTEERQS